MRFLVPGVALLLAGAGCDKNCQNTCYRIYDPGECGIQVSGLSEQELKDTCVFNCTQALKEAGDMGTYDPYAPSPNENPSLDNEKQAAAWMDCVWQAECSQLEVVGGICKPIGSGQGDN